MTRKNEQLNDIYKRLKDAGFTSNEINKLKFRSLDKIELYEAWGKKYKQYKSKFEKEKTKFINDPKYIPIIEGD